MQNPPLYLQTELHPAEHFRHLVTVVAGDRSGVVAGLAVTETAGTATMGVEVAAGTVAVKGTESATQGVYLCRNVATQTLPVAPSDPIHPRVDVLYATVDDSVYSGTDNQWSLNLVTGVAEPVPNIALPPQNSVAIAVIEVPPGAPVITDADIIDLRASTWTINGIELGSPMPAPAAGRATPAESVELPSTAHTGDLAAEVDTGILSWFDGVAWRPSAPYMVTHGHVNGAFQTVTANALLPIASHSSLGSAPSNGTLVVSFQGRALNQDSLARIHTAIRTPANSNDNWHWTTIKPHTLNEYSPMAVQRVFSHTAGENMGFNIAFYTSGTTDTAHFTGVYTAVFYPEIGPIPGAPV